MSPGEGFTSDLECSNASVTVRVNDFNDNPPTFSSPLYEVDIAEDIPANNPLPNLKLEVTDPDQVS